MLLFSLAVACTPTEAQLIEGILENVDTANGEITIVTKDGKTITLTISTDDAENADGSTTSISTLSPGILLEIEATEGEGGQIARRVKARQSEVEGTIVEINGQEISIESSDGEVTVVILDDNSRIELADDAQGNISGLVVGQSVEAEFDPESRAAFKLESEDEDDKDNGEEDDEDEDEDDDDKDNGEEDDEDDDDKDNGEVENKDDEDDDDKDNGEVENKDDEDDDDKDNGGEDDEDDDDKDNGEEDDEDDDDKDNGEVENKDDGDVDDKDNGEEDDEDDDDKDNGEEDDEDDDDQNEEDKDDDD